MGHQCLEDSLKYKIKYSCVGCVWENQCGGLVPCSDYDPADEDENIEEYIEARRFEFGQDWLGYVRGWN